MSSLDMDKPAFCLIVLLAGSASCASFKAGNGPSAGTDGGASSSSSDAGIDASARDARPPMVDAPDEGGTGARDSTVPSDALSDGPTTEGGVVACGSLLCLPGQVCAGGSQCEFQGCTGVNVPGDFAKISDAVASLGVAGGIICLGAQSSSELVELTVTGPITLQGISPALTKLKAVDVQSSSFTLRGLAVDSVSVVGADPVTTHSIVVTASTLGNASVGLTAFNLTLTDGAYDVRFDGVEMVGLPGSSPAIDVHQFSGTLDLVLQNSFVHDSQGGVIYLSGAEAGALQANLTLVNNTFVGNESGILVRGGSGSVVATYFNNIVDNSGTGITISGAIDSSGDNALFGNGIDYSGSAGAGPGYVSADPSLDTSTDPPGLLPGSPCRGAGDSSRAPPYDYWGRARGALPDMGAVQSP